MEGQDRRNASSSPVERPQLDPRNLIPVPTLTADGSGKILWLNHAAEELLGRPQEEIVGRIFGELLSPRSRRRFVRDIWRWKKGEEPELSLELPLRGPQNVARWAGLRVRRVPFRPDTPVFVASFYDLDGVYAERERLQRQVGELEARVREANAAAELKSDFLRVAGEQIRTPMSGLIEMSRLLLETELGPEQLTYAELLSGSSRDLLDVVNDLLDFTRIESGTLEIRELDFDLRVTIDTVAGAIGGWAAEQQRPFRIQIDPSVPTALTGDPARLRQVLLTLGRSLLVPDSTDPLTLSVRVAQETARNVELAVQLRTRVTPEGVAEAQLLRQALAAGSPEAMQQLGGKGMSLRLSRQMISLLRGRLLEAETAAEDVQLVFQVPFLKQEEVIEPAVEVQAAESVPETGDALQGKRALIADPFGRCGGTIVPVLDSVGIEAVHVRSGAEVVERVIEAQTAGRPFDFALLDAVLPDQSLDQVVHQLRSAGSSSTRLLMTTSMGQPGDAEWASRLGFGAYLPMPIAEEDLTDALREILRRGEGAAAAQSLITRHGLAERRMRLRGPASECDPVSDASAPPQLGLVEGDAADPIAPGFQNWDAEGRPAHAAAPRDEWQNFFGDEEKKAA